LLTEPEGYSEAALQLYSRAGCTIRAGTPEYEGLSPKDVTTIVIRLGRYIDGTYLSQFPRLRFIVSPTTGLNHIDHAACSARGIEIISLKGETAFLDSITATSELALGLMMALVRHIPAAHHSVTADMLWNRDLFCARMLSRMTVGVIGFGRLGRQMARICSGTGMRVIACDPYVHNDVFTAAGVSRTSLEELAENSDVISIHVDYRPENDGMIDAAFLSHCRPGTLMINTARGELCDEEAVAAALDSGTLGGLATDVLRDEQSRAALAEHPFVVRARKGMNILITPHLGGCCTDAMRETEEFAARKLLDRLESASG
jgi:D-3-phosphoglycerate dehydrogenase